MPDRSRLDKRLVRASFNRAADTYDEAAGVQRQVGDHLIQRHGRSSIDPRWILDVGAGTGFHTARLVRCYRSARVVALDISHRMLTCSQYGRTNCGLVNGDAECLPLASQSFDMLFSNLTIQWCNDLGATLKEFARVLRDGGSLLLSTFGPKTLHELRASWAAVDRDVHVNTFTTAAELGDALSVASFHDSQIDSRIFTITYGDMRALMQNLKATGAHNVNLGRWPTLTGKHRLRMLTEAYEKYRGDDGLLPATYEVIYISAVRRL